MWQQWVNAVLGLWILAVPFFFGVADNTLTWTLAISGLVVAVLGIWGAGEHQTEHSARMAHGHQ